MRPNLSFGYRAVTEFFLSWTKRRGIKTLVIPRTHNRKFRQEKSDVSFWLEIPTVCRHHRTFAVGISTNKRLRAGSLFFRRKKFLSENLLVCMQFRRAKKHACSESSRRAELPIGLHWTWIVVCVVRHRVLGGLNFRQDLCDRVQHKFEPTFCQKKSTVFVSEFPIVCTRHYILDSPSFYLGDSGL